MPRILQPSHQPILIGVIGLITLAFAPVLGGGLIIWSIVRAIQQRQRPALSSPHGTGGILAHATHPGRPYALIIDTETTGLPPHRSQPTRAELRAQPQAWPHVVQLAWIIISDDLRIIDYASHYIIQQYPIPQRAIDIHGITNAYCSEHGIPLHTALQELSTIATQCHYLVGHHLRFDEHIITAECHRLGIPPPFTRMKRYDTMSLSRHFGRHTISLTDLSTATFGHQAMRAFDPHPHDALDDAWLTASLFVHYHE